MGGPCDEEMVAATSDEMMQKGAAHLTAKKDDPAHKQAFDMMVAMQAKPEEGEAWNKEFAAKFDAISENQLV